jgi:hypothetical protein
MLPLAGFCGKEFPPGKHRSSGFFQTRTSASTFDFIETRSERQNAAARII